MPPPPIVRPPTRCGTRPLPSSRPVVATNSRPVPPPTRPTAPEPAPSPVIVNKTVITAAPPNAVNQNRRPTAPIKPQPLRKLLVGISVKKTKVRKQFLKPNAVDVHFGCLSPLAVMVRPFHQPQKKYVKPDGAGRVTIIGFIEEEEAIVRGFGFHRRFELLDAYQEPCFKLKHNKYDLKSIKKNKILFEIMSRGLRMTGAAAYCILHEKSKTSKPSYGFMVVDRQRDAKHLILGLLKDGFIGSETWKNRLDWTVKTKNYKFPPFVRSPYIMLNEQCWTRQYFMAKSTSAWCTKLTDGSLQPSKFSKIVDQIIEHAQCLGMNLHWLKELLKYFHDKTKSKDSALAIDAGLKKVDIIEKKSRFSG